MINVVLSGLMFLILMYARFLGEFSILNVLNGLFVVGIIMFSVGILTVTNAGQAFRGIGFIYKKMFSKKYTSTSYYEYLKTLDSSEKEKPTGWPALLVGMIYLALSIIFSVIEYL
ncbi:MAG: DUF3899 domain-containing protein [Tenericutes bacterium]|nr:DUF3899 domain-containing protein [Mycoplasmatota bacterium]